MPAGYKAPGVYIEEIAGGARPLEAAGTAVAAFIGFTEKAPLDRPVDDPDGVRPRFITTWGDYEKLFGGVVPDATLPHAVRGYFDNGGSSAYIVRIPHLLETATDAAMPMATIAPPDGQGTLTITAKVDADDLAVRFTPIKALGPGPAQVTPPPAPAPAGPAGKEPAAGASASPAAPEAPTYVVKVFQGGVRKEAFPPTMLADLATLPSDLVSISSVGELAIPEGSYNLAAVREPITDVNVLKESMLGDQTRRTGIAGLAGTEDVTMVIVPDLHRLAVPAGSDNAAVAWKAVQDAVITHCELMKDRMAILDAPPDKVAPDEVRQWRGEDAMYDSMFAALYYPWIRIVNPFGAGMLAVPPSGHVAGVWARTDEERGVWKAPANQIVRGALELEHRTTRAEQEILNPEGTNCIRAFGTEGIRIWGGRTLSSDGQWRYLNIRRLFNMVETTIKNGTNWVVFEPNDADTWAKVSATVTAFLMGLWRQGAFFGSTPAEAFFVRCDATTNPPDGRDRGELVIEVGISPLKPAEFVIFRVSQWQPTTA